MGGANMACSAIVARTTNDGLTYLRGRYSARVDWVSETNEADTFESVREATRAALVLPGQLRAFALPLGKAA